MPEGQKYISWSLTSLGMSCKLQNIFLWFLKVSWIARRSKITFLKFDKSWNVLQASKYFSMIFKSLLDCQKVQYISWCLTGPWMSCKLWNIFLLFLKVSWIGRMSKITFLKSHVGQSSLIWDRKVVLWGTAVLESPK